MADFRTHPISLREAVFVLKLKRGQGCESVTFTGGEPTMHPELPLVLRYAKGLGYRTHLITNGNVLANATVSGRILPHLDEICVSIHGASAAVMDPITRLSGSFALVDRALRNIEDSPARLYVATSCIASAGNVGHLSETLAYLAQFKKVKHFTVANVAPISGGEKRYTALALPLARLAEEVPGLALLAGRQGIALRFFGTPPCVLGPEYRHLADDFHWPKIPYRIVVQRGRDASGRIGLVETTTAGHVRERAQTEACRPCALRGTCAGLFREYFVRFGDGELRPVAGAVPKEARQLTTFRQTAFWPASGKGGA